MPPGTHSRSSSAGSGLFPSILFSNQEPLEDWIIFFSKKKIVLYVAKKILDYILLKKIGLYNNFE
jgi:hypothetical protein